MKLWLTILLVACTPHDDLATLRDRAFALDAYYRPRLAELEQRLKSVMKRGPMLGRSVPGNEAAHHAEKHAGQALAELANLVMPDEHGRSALEARADTLAGARAAAELAGFVDDTARKLERDTAAINSELASAESWLLQAEAIVSSRPPPP